MKQQYTLLKVSSTNDKPRTIHPGDSIVGLIQFDSLHVGLPLMVSGLTKWRITSEILEITEKEDGYLIKTLNSMYTLTEYNPKKHERKGKVNMD